MSAELKSIKQANNLDGILVADAKGFEIYNSGFNNSHHLHALKQLSSYFFPDATGTTVAIDTTEYSIVILEGEGDRLVAVREAKEGQ